MRSVFACATVVVTAMLPQLVHAQQWISQTMPGGAIEFVATDQEIAMTLEKTVQVSRRDVEQFFGAPYPKSFTVKIFPDRGSMDQYWRTAWHQPEPKSACWMVASGIAKELDLLSPRVWSSSACEHDPADQPALQRLITHELVHVYHAQNNTDQEMANLDEIAWFVEGLATYVSGQLDTERFDRAKAELAKLGHAPPLSALWTGPDRYGMSGSLVRYIDETFGRKTLIQMLGASNQDDLLSMIDLEEDELLENWRRWMLYHP